jgi:hypothetical protein
LNVIPATSSFSTPINAPLTLPIPSGSISGCSPVGNSGNGPVAGAVYGCTTAVIHGSGTNPAHGTLSVSGSTIVYTPNSAFNGIDTFTYQVRGVNNDGNSALNSGNVTGQVTVGFVPSTPIPPTWILMLLALGGWGLWVNRRRLMPFSARRLT